MVASLDKLLNDIELLQLDFPVTTIAARTGVDKGNASSYLKGRKPLGKKFVEQFYRVFAEEIRQARNSANRTTPLVPSQYALPANSDAMATIERITQGVNRLEILAWKVLHQHKENSALLEKLRRELNIPIDSPNQ